MNDGSIYLTGVSSTGKVSTTSRNGAIHGSALVAQFESASAMGKLAVYELFIGSLPALSELFPGVEQLAPSVDVRTDGGDVVIEGLRG